MGGCRLHHVVHRVHCIHGGARFAHGLVGRLLSLMRDSYSARVRGAILNVFNLPLDDGGRDNKIMDDGGRVNKIIYLTLTLTLLLNDGGRVNKIIYCSAYYWTMGVGSTRSFILSALQQGP